MTEVIGVRFTDAGKIYTFDPVGHTLGKGDMVVVETSRGVECGTVAAANYKTDESNLYAPLKPILRVAGEDDRKRVEDNRAKEKRAFDICKKKIAKHGLDMKLIRVEYAFDNKKILFYFTADGRVDFRELVKDLAGVFHTRIELRQIGVRDEAKMVGGLGICGRPLCCSQHLCEFQPVSIKMAKEQGLSLNPSIISGSCGRLMCCLKYEQPAYEYLLKITPRVGSSVETEEGRGTVIEVNLVSGELKVRLENNPDAAPYTTNRQQVQFLQEERHSEKKPDRNGKEKGTWKKSK